MSRSAPFENRWVRAALATLLSAVTWLTPTPSRAAPEGQITWGVHISLAPTWFDPAETPGIITPFMIMYALHDAMVKPMPGIPLAPSLAESWTVSRDGRAYEFVLRKGARFHNGEPVTADDVKFSFERYRGAAAQRLKDRVAEVVVVDAGHIRFQLKEPWPDFMTFYGTTASGAGWIVPKKHVEQVGEDGFKKAPVGAGPYKVVSIQPGVELVMEAFEQYWRKAPSIKRLVLRAIPEESTRLAALKKGEVDIAYLFSGPVAEELKRATGLRLVPVLLEAPFWLDLPEQWDSKSPWANVKVRRAASLAIDRQGVNQAETLGFSRPTGTIIPSNFEFVLRVKPDPFDPAKAKQLLAEAGYPNGFDAGDFTPFPPYFTMGEAILGQLQSVGIRSRMRSLERAAFLSAWHDKKLKGIILGISGAKGNAATRIEAYVAKGGMYVAGSVPEIDDLFLRQEREMDRKKREGLLLQIQKLMEERQLHIPIYELAFLWGVGPRVEEAGADRVKGYPYSAPYEDMKLKKQ